MIKIRIFELIRKRNSISNQKTKVFLSAILSVSTILLDKIAFFLINIIIARYLAPELFGEYSAALAYAAFFAGFIEIGIEPTLKRMINLDKQYQAEHILNAVLIKSSLSVVVLVITMVSLGFTDFNRNTVILTVLFSLVRVGSAFMMTAFNFYESGEEFFKSTLMRLSFSIFLLIGTIVVIILNLDYFALVQLRLAFVLLFVSVFFYFIFKNNGLIFKYKKFKEFVKNSMLFGLADILLNVSSNIGPYLISILSGTLFVGFFNNAYLLYQTALFIHGALVSAITPSLYREEEPEKLIFLFDTYTRLFSAIGFTLFIFTFIYSNDLIALFYGSNYDQSSIVLKIVSLNFPLYFIVSTVFLTTMDKRKVLVVICGVQAAVSSILGFILIKKYGYEGAAYTTIVSTLLNVLISIAYLRSKRVVRALVFIKTNIKLVLISMIIFLLHYSLLDNMFFILSGTIEMALYLILVFFIVLGNEYIKLIREMAGKSREFIN